MDALLIKLSVCVISPASAECHDALGHKRLLEKEKNECFFAFLPSSFPISARRYFHRSDETIRVQN